MALDPAQLTALAVVAAVLILSGWVHQAVKGYRTKSLRDVSGYLTVMIGVGACLWLAYGLEVADWYIVGTNAAAIVLMLVVTGMKRRYDAAAAGRASTA